VFEVMVRVVNVVIGVIGVTGVTFEDSRALAYAKFAGAAYCSQKSLENWDCGPKCSAAVTDVTVCNGDSVKSFVTTWEDKCLVSFEGTSNVGSAIKDLEFYKSGTPWAVCGGCTVHAGFLDSYNSMKSCIMDSLSARGCSRGDSIRTTGHSLGAGINSLAMMDLTDQGWVIEESYDFGQPRTGDETFAAKHNELFFDKFWRVTHDRDPFVHLPPTDFLGLPWHFTHAEPESFYGGHVSGGHVECTVAEDYSCAGYYYNVPIDALFINDHLTYMDVDTSTFGCSGAFRYNTMVGNNTILTVGNASAMGVESSRAVLV